MARFGPQRRGEGALMRFGSVCTGIDAAFVAWGPLGWRAAFFSEIEPAPARVLMARHGATRPLHPADPAHAPDARTGEEWARWAKAIARMPEGGAIPNYGDMQRFSEWPDHDIDLLVGGTPCQSFSVAGLRRGLDDPRGSLMLTFGSVARRYRPRWLVWENVPGVLSQDGGRAFGTFLGMLGELGYGFAYRVLDARFFGVPQRRRRVFVVGCLGDWRAAAAVFLEPESLRGNPAASGQAREDLAPTLAAGARGGGGLGTDAECDGALIAQTIRARPASGTVSRQYPASKGVDSDCTDTLIAHTLRAEGFDASEDGTGRGVPLVPIAFAIQERAVSENLEAGPQGAGFAQEIAYTLEARNTVQSVAFGGSSDPIDVASALTAHGKRMDFETETFVTAFNGRMDPVSGAIPGAIDTDRSTQCVYINLRGREGGAMPETDALASMRAANGGSSRSYFATSCVRRLTETECERLQGFPDGFTAVPGLSSGARYKALGNSMAVPVMRWIGERIVLVEQVLASLADRPPALEVAHPPKAKPRQEQQTSLLEAAKGSQREGAEELGSAA